MDTKKTLLKELDKIRTLRRMSIRFDEAKCTGVFQCSDVCPVGCWTPNHRTRKAEFHHPELCIACGACVLQCPKGAIALTPFRRPQK